MTLTDHTRVDDALERYTALTRPALEHHLPGGETVDYLFAPVADYPSRGGKGLRPALCLATAEAFGGRIEDALPSAVAIELLHNAFLIHDDIEDLSKLRRGEPTLHLRYGMPLALNAGDALAFSALGALEENLDRLGPRLSRRVYAEFSFMSRQTVAGQALDIGWRIDNRLDTTPNDYLDLIMKKTCWYTTVLPLRVGALIGSDGRARLDPMIEFGFRLGAAFQIRDDLLNLVGDPSAYGKERFGDLVEAKRTLMLIHLLGAASPQHLVEVNDFLASSRDERTAEAVLAVYDLMVHYGSIAFAEDYAAGIAYSATEAFDVAFAGLAASPALAFIRDLIGYMIERKT